MIKYKMEKRRNWATEREFPEDVQRAIDFNRREAGMSVLNRPEYNHKDVMKELLGEPQEGVMARGSDRDKLYFLHKRGAVYQFVADKPEGAVTAIPSGKKIVVNKKTGKPSLVSV